MPTAKSNWTASSIIGVIAFQTNIPALNAAVGRLKARAAELLAGVGVFKLDPNHHADVLDHSSQQPAWRWERA